MSSLIQGYEYDIFISYRQKDNKHDGWVIEFVNNLKGELEATYIKIDPLFNSIRNEPEFQRIVREIEAKYQAEHERVRKWLEEQGML